MNRLFTSGVQRAAAEWCSHGGLLLPVMGLDDDLVALHQSLTDKLLKHLRSTHHRGFILSPEKVRKKAVFSVIMNPFLLLWPEFVPSRQYWWLYSFLFISNYVTVLVSLW